VRVVLDYVEDTLLITVRNGAARRTAAPVGAAAAGLGAGGFGLVGMCERVAMLNGLIEAGPDADGGFAVRASLPAPSSAVASVACVTGVGSAVGSVAVSGLSGVRP
jgi:signal transduction histidine kinase